MHTTLDLYQSALATLDAAQRTFKAIRKNLRREDSALFKSVVAAEVRRYRSPAKRSESLRSRREVLESIVLKNWSLPKESNPDYHAICCECDRIGELCHAAGLYASGSSPRQTVRRIALHNGLLPENAGRY
jgi:hypothetical protein